MKPSSLKDPFFYKRLVPLQVKRIFREFRVRKYVLIFVTAFTAVGTVAILAYLY